MVWLPGARDSAGSIGARIPAVLARPRARDPNRTNVMRARLNGQIDGADPRLQISHRQHHRRRSFELAEAADVAEQDRRPDGMRFDDRQAKAFVQSGVQHRRGAHVKARHVVFADEGRQHESIVKLSWHHAADLVMRACFQSAYDHRGRGRR